MYCVTFMHEAKAIVYFRCVRLRWLGIIFTIKCDFIQSKMHVCVRGTYDLHSFLGQVKPNVFVPMQWLHQWWVTSTCAALTFCKIKWQFFLVNLVLMSKFAATMMMLFVVTVHNFWIRFDGRSMFIACRFCGRPINTHLFPDTRYVTEPTDSADK